MPRKKREVSDIIKANEGLDSARALSHARNVLLNHDLKQPVLYHLVFTGSQSIPVYQATIKSLIRRIRSRCRLEYFGAYEIAEDKGGLHAHCLILIETGRGKTPFGILDVNDGKYLHKLAVRHGLNRIHISQPKNKMHYSEDGKRQFFARPTPGPLLENCLDWIEYPFKSRSKDGIPAREKYFNSEFKANKVKRAAHMQRYYAPTPAALPAAEESIAAEVVVVVAPALNEANIPLESGKANNQSKGSMDNQLTASQKYLASLYERGVDADLDTDAMRLYLLENGVKRTPGQLQHDLDEVFCFAGYFASHPPKPVQSVAEWDRLAYRG